MHTPAHSPDHPPDHPSSACPPSPAHLAAVQASRWASVGCALALALLCLVWEMWLAPLRPGGTWLALKALPLLLPLAGLLKNRLYTYRWVSLLLWLYVCEGLMRATTEAGWSRALAVAEVLLALGLFAACVWHIRLRLRTARPHPQTASAQPTEAVSTANTSTAATATTTVSAATTATSHTSAATSPSPPSPSTQPVIGSDPSRSAPS